MEADPSTGQAAIERHGHQGGASEAQADQEGQEDRSPGVVFGDGCAGRRSGDVNHEHHDLDFCNAYAIDCSQQ